MEFTRQEHWSGVLLPSLRKMLVNEQISHIGESYMSTLHSTPENHMYFSSENQESTLASPIKQKNILHLYFYAFILYGLSCKPRKMYIVAPQNVSLFENMVSPNVII